ncbi:HAD-IA family hydrolase [Nakamurella sp. YIM 132087]|uniref:HAD-IA family hydrolase n=1 Tax=Nakamurella alba TaxID=2665158 RepID=A0A7K1FRS1_9ACTN|nr:HAD-IA family hydrolase [Nakamurella alba]MTD16059.1 HAD-IA family hydrolase [Nakamurella alba]
MPQLHADAVLFDLDGTLVDSTASVMRNWAKVAVRLGRAGEDLVADKHGMPARQVVELIAPDLGPDGWDELAAFVLDGEVNDTHDVVPTPGALDVLAALPRDRWGVVTSGTRKLATRRMQAAGIPVPDVLVTADDVRVGKPDPTPFRLGAERIGVPADRCIAVEDAHAGIVSATAAGCQVLGLLTTYDRLEVPAVPDLRSVAVGLADGVITFGWD